jgi:hypothetical protein
MLRDFVVASLRRAWLGIVGLTVFGFVAYLIIDRDNLLRSDDPYLVGFLLGGIAAGMSLVYSIAERLRASRWWATFCHGLVLCLWAILVLATSNNSSEAEEMGRVVAGASVVGGAISWPLIAFRIPRNLLVILTAGALTILVMYVVVAVRIALTCRG